MPRVSRTCVAALLLLAAACNDTELPTAPPPAPESPATDAPAAVSRRAARERLASRLAVALADPALRADFARRFAQSDAPEGKLQFQRLARADNQMLLNRLASGGGGSIGSELCRQVARLGASRLVILEQSEYNLYRILRELEAQQGRVALGDERRAGAASGRVER